MPALIAPSPITAIALPGWSGSLLATAKPSAAEIEVELCAAPNGSYSLSLRLVKPRQPAALAQRADAVAPAGEDLVRIGLVADVPDQPVVGRVEHIMDRDGQLDHAEPGAEMPAGDRHRRDRLGAQLVGELAAAASGRACADRRASRPGREAVYADDHSCWYLTPPASIQAGGFAVDAQLVEQSS